MNEEPKKPVGQQMRFSDAELEVIKATFKDNEPLLKLMRKVFLPELDPDVPLGQQLDLWMTVNIDNLDPVLAIANLRARNTVIMHLEQRLMELRALADSKAETPEEAVARLRKDSTK